MIVQTQIAVVVYFGIADSLHTRCCQRSSSSTHVNLLRIPFGFNLESTFPVNSRTKLKIYKKPDPFRGQVSFLFFAITAPLCKIQTPVPLGVSKKVEAKPIA